MTYDGLSVPKYPSASTGIEPQSDDLVFSFGESDATQLSWDLKWYANEASGASYLYCDASGNLVYTTGVDLQIKDDDFLVFGSGAGAAGDVQLEWDTSGTAGLDLGATADNTPFVMGNGTLNFDIQLFGSGAANYLKWDASALSLTASGKVDLMLYGSETTDSLKFDASASSLTASGKLDLVWYGTDSGDSLTFDASASNLIGSGNVDFQFYGTSASSYIKWDAGGDQLITSGKMNVDFEGSASSGLLWEAGADTLLLRNSGTAPVKLNMGTNTTSPATGVDIGDLFILKTGSTYRLGVVTTGTTKAFVQKFQFTEGSSS
jgi:hypothetical protein